MTTLFENVEPSPLLTRWVQQQASPLGKLDGNHARSDCVWRGVVRLPPPATGCFRQAVGCGSLEPDAGGAEDEEPLKENRAVVQRAAGTSPPLSPIMSRRSYPYP